MGVDPVNVSKIALDALEAGTRALTLIESHEKICTVRWATVTRFMALNIVGLIAGMGSILGFLLIDKFF